MRIPETMRFRITKAAATKIRKVNRAFSRIPKIFRPATLQMMNSTATIKAGLETGKKEAALDTALTAEMQAVRI